MSIDDNMKALKEGREPISDIAIEMLDEAVFVGVSSHSGRRPLRQPQDMASRIVIPAVVALIGICEELHDIKVQMERRTNWERGRV